MDKNLKQNYEALKRLEKAKSDLMNVMSHELRTPLATILGYAELLEDELGGPLTDMQREHLKEIQTGANRLASLFNDLLDFARLQSGQFKLERHEVELTVKLRQAAEELAPAAQAKGVELIIDLPTYLLVNADTVRIAQVITNLLSNAVKFTEPGGKVTLKARKFRDDWCVEVRDTGCGIPDEAQDRLFQQFYQVDGTNTRAHGGLGMGLAISKAIVEAHGGDIHVDSTVGKGSNFWFRIPC